MDCSNIVGYAKDFRNKSGLHSNVLLVAQRVFTSMMQIMQPANRGLVCQLHSGLFSALAVNVREAHAYVRAIQPCNTHL